MKIPRLSCVAVLLPLIICSCTPSVETARETSRGYHSARFVETTRVDRPASPNALEDDPDFNSTIRSAITREFVANGVPVTKGSADLIIAYMLLRQNSVATTFNRDYFGNGRDAIVILEEAHNRGVTKNQSPDDFLNGAILIDILDAKTNRLVFRNYAVRPVLNGASSTVRKNKINSAVAQALSPFFKK